MTYQEAVDYLYKKLPMYQNIGAKAFNKDLSRTLKLLDHLDNPHKKFKSIHIAGTNGKGSTAHLLASVYQEAGYRVGLHTSPHLKSFRERIRINGSKIDESDVVNFVESMNTTVEEIKPSFFELTVAMAFKYFADQNVDLAIVEVGLGGRLDSTNVLTPQASIITSIGLDHQAFLGDTISEIAREKAGIIKPAVPVIIGDLKRDAIEEIELISNRQNAILHEAIKKYRTVIDEKLEVTKDGKTFLNGISSDLYGDALIKNLPVVCQTVEILADQFIIEEDELKRGIENVCSNTGLMGRWQTLTNSPLTICDVGHNEEAFRQITKRLRELTQAKVHVVLGMVEEKVTSKVLQELDKDWSYYFCRPSIARAMSAKELSIKCAEHGLIGEEFKTVKTALCAAQKAAEGDEIVFVGGSTFVVAEVIE